MANEQPTIEAKRDTLFRDGTAFRARVVQALEQAYQIKITLREAVFRTSIRKTETRSGDLLKSFLEYDDRVSALIQQMGTAQQVQTSSGLKSISLNTQFQFAIYVSQLSTHRDSIRSAMSELSGVTGSRRAEANAMTALFVSLASLFVALFLGVVGIMAR